MSNQGFSLFPTTVPKISIPNPHRKAPSLHSISLVASPESAVSPNAESVVIRMEGERPPLPQLPAHLGPGRYPSPPPEDIGRAVTTSSPIDGRTPTQRVPPPPLPVTYTPSLYESPKPMYSSPQAMQSPQPSFTPGMGSATTLIHTQNLITRKSPVDPSPVVPIRSMFPTYDPSVHLTKQSYVPQRPMPARLSGLGPIGALSREDYRSSLSMPFAASAQRTAPASILNFPSDVMSVNMGPRISTQRDLEKLWEASHGTEPDFAIKSFTLEMARTEEATFIFGSHPSMPFYTLQTYDNNEIAISKTCPRKSTLTRDVALCPLEPSSRRQPPSDGLVAFIFPKLAAMMAINQSASLAREHNLAPTDRDDIEAQAVRRAAKQEACNLRYNARGGFYELEHPAIGRGAMSGDFAMQSPLPSSPTTIRSITGKPVLHITVSTDGPLPTISVVDPNASRRMGTNPLPLTPVTSGAQSIRRLSTIPLTDTTSGGTSLATLDLTAQTLFIDANGILELMPSLFSLDCIVSAILAVAVTDAATNPAMGAMEIRRASPAPASRFGGTTKRPGSVKSYAGSAFYATIAERDEAEEEAKLMRETHEKDVRGRGTVKMDSRTWFGWKKDGEQESDDVEKGGFRGKSKGNKGKTKKIVMTEFDLEKMGHYQSGDRQGQELPVVTRSALGGLVVGLKLLVWALTMIVQVLAWVLVHVSRAVTSEKF